MTASEKRKPVSKRLRFEVFKRDGFVCQYCGAHPPAVVLHVDHIIPVAEGGRNDMDNLVTACEPCNLGKSAVPLSVVPQSLADKAEEVAEREAQLLGYQKILDERRDRITSDAWRVVHRFLGEEQDAVDRQQLQSIRYFVEQLGVHPVLDAADKAIFRVDGRQYWPSQIPDARFRYFCGICWKFIREGCPS